MPPHRVTTTELVSAVMGPIPASVSKDSWVMFLKKNIGVHFVHSIHIKVQYEAVSKVRTSCTKANFYICPGARVRVGLAR